MWAASCQLRTRFFDIYLAITCITFAWAASTYRQNPAELCDHHANFPADSSFLCSLKRAEFLRRPNTPSHPGHKSFSMRFCRQNLRRLYVKGFSYFQRPYLKAHIPPVHEGRPEQLLPTPYNHLLYPGLTAAIPGTNSCFTGQPTIPGKFMWGGVASITLVFESLFQGWWPVEAAEIRTLKIRHWEIRNRKLRLSNYVIFYLALDPWSGYGTSYCTTDGFYPAQEAAHLSLEIGIYALDRVSLSNFGSSRCTES